MAKTLLITGASSGIGEATARAAAGAGWNVALLARSEDKLATIAEDLGDKALAVPGDCTDYGFMQSAVARLPSISARSTPCSRMPEPGPRRPAWKMATRRNGKR